MQPSPTLLGREACAAPPPAAPARLALCLLWAITCWRKECGAGQGSLRALLTAPDPGEQGGAGWFPLRNTTRRWRKGDFYFIFFSCSFSIVVRFPTQEWGDAEGQEGRRRSFFSRVLALEATSSRQGSEEKMCRERVVRLLPPPPLQHPRVPGAVWAPGGLERPPGWAELPLSGSAPAMYQDFSGGADSGARPRLVASHPALSRFPLAAQGELVQLKRAEQTRFTPFLPLQLPTFAPAGDSRWHFTCN